MLACGERVGVLLIGGVGDVRDVRGRGGLHLHLVLMVMRPPPSPPLPLQVSSQPDRAARPSPAGSRPLPSASGCSGQHAPAGAHGHANVQGQPAGKAAQQIVLHRINVRRRYYKMYSKMLCMYFDVLQCATDVL